MTKIKSTVFCDFLKLKNVIENAGFDLEKQVFPVSLACVFNYFLPLRLKFASESFVAYDKEKILGLISLEKDERSSSRFKITRVFLEQNSFDVGKLLVDYVIARYCAMGAVSYQVVVENTKADLLSLFIDGCGFRKNAQEYVYLVNSNDFINKDNSCLEGFKFYKNIRTSEVCRLYNSNINSYQRHSFSKTKQQFEPLIAYGMSEKTSFSYVLEDEQKGKIYGYFCISTYNNSDYVLDFVLDSPFEIYFDDALSFVAKVLNNRTKNWNLYVKIKSYFANYTAFKEYFETKGNSLVKSGSILTKDYLQEIKENNLLKNAKIVFNDITPAFKTGSK